MGSAESAAQAAVQSPDVRIFGFVLWAYLIAFALFLICTAWRRRGAGMAALVALGVGFVLQTVAIIIRWHLSGHVPLTSMHEYASAMSWMAAAFLGYLVIRTGRFTIGAYVAPVIVAIVAIGSLVPKSIQHQLVPALQSYWLYIHVSMAALAEGAFAVSCGLAIFYLIKARQRSHILGAAAASADREVKRGRELEGDLDRELERLDSYNHTAISLGYPLFTLGALFAGAIWAYNAWGSFWSWDPKEVGSLIIWLFYTGYLHARYQRGWRGRRAAVLAIIGFVMVILSFLGNLVLGGEHAYG